MKVLFCGLGSIGQRHLRNLKALRGNNVEILAYRARGKSSVLDPDMTVRSDVDLEAVYGLRSFTNLDDAIAERPDAAFITNPNSQHLPVAIAAARAGCHLFIEKPLSHSLEGVDELIELVESRNLTAMVAYQFRFHPGLILVKSFIEAGRLGNLIAAHIVNGEYLPDWHPYEDYRETHPARQDLGGGCLSIQTHEIDCALWFFGMPKRVFAVGGHLSSLEVNVEDSVTMLLQCDRGNGLPLPVSIHLDYLQRPPRRICEVIGDAGTVRYDYYANQVEFHNARTRGVEIHQFDDFDRNKMFVDELVHFFDCVQANEKPIVDLKAGVQSLQISLAARRALSEGRGVDC